MEKLISSLGMCHRGIKFWDFHIFFFFLVTLFHSKVIALKHSDEKVMLFWCLLK